MFKFIKKTTNHESELYNKILSLSRNKLFYTKADLIDNFQNRINLIFLHISFLFIKVRGKKSNLLYKNFYQDLFDYTFKQIEINMREIGYGDVTVNKNMKFLVKTFYSILLNCENYSQKDPKYKKLFLYEFLSIKNNKVSENNITLIDYFDKYYSFCLDLTCDTVLKGDLNFKYI